MTASASSTPATVRPSYTGPVPSASLTYVPASSSAAATGDEHLAAAGALAESDSGDGSKFASDLTSLERNSYIIMGLLGGVIVLLLAVVGISFKAARANRRYQPLVPVVGLKEFEMGRSYDG